MRILFFIFALLPFAQSVRAAPCGELFAFSASYVDGLAEDDCILRDSFDLGVSGSRQTYKIYDAASSSHARQAWHLTVAREAIERSAIFYGRLARMPSATVIFGGGAPTVGAGDGGRRAVLGETFPKIFDKTCVVSITDAAMEGIYGTPAGEEELRLTIAHELFHCVQYENWQRRVSDVMFRHAAWWIEGTAEYIQHEVYPEYALFRNRAPDFDAQIGREGLLGAQHANAVFFSYYAEVAGGPAGVMSFIERMAVNPGRDVQVSALSGVPDIANVFQNFARRYLDCDLRSPGGHVIPVNPARGETFRVEEPGERDVRVAPFAIRAVNMIFGRGENWLIDIASGGSEAQSGFRYQEMPGDWSGTPFDVLSCATDRTVMLAATATPRIEETKTLRLRFETRTGDMRTCPCPLGRWTITPEDMNAKFPVSVYGASLGPEESNKGWRFQFASGTPSLVFNQDGTADYTAHLTFKTDEKPVKVPENCNSDACVRSCLAARSARREFCAPTKIVMQQWRVQENTFLSWTWRRRGDILVRTMTGGTKHLLLYFNDGFSERLIQRTPQNTGVSTSSGNPFRCVGSELILDPTPASGSAATLDDLIAQLERGNAQQRAAAAQLRALKDRPGGDRIAREMMDRMAAGEASGVIAYPFSGRFVR
jgi:hypothetical protein